MVFLCLAIQNVLIDLYKVIARSILLNLILCSSLLHRTNRTRRLFIASLQLQQLLLLFRSAQGEIPISAIHWRIR